jgi:pimeloyl-ACP methyl ester carboxylesterase
MLAYEDLFTTSHDGLQLHARRWGPELSPRLPVVCLPGLSRNTSDFDDIAAVLAENNERTVYAFDYRGRGLSSHDPNWKNYDIKIEIADILDQVTALGIGRAVFFGTSRGGLLTMLVAMLRPLAIAGAILNDIGPIINGKGLARLKSYVGKLPQPRTFEEGAAIMKSVNNTQFPNLGEADWLTFARRTWAEKDGRPVLSYDVNLMKTLETVDLEAPLPELWPQFEALFPVPLLVLRGAHSDILSGETARQMVARHPDASLVEVAYEGHAPLLMDAPTQGAIRDFIRRCDAAAPPPTA